MASRSSMLLLYFGCLLVLIDASVAQITQEEDLPEGNISSSDDNSSIDEFDVVIDESNTTTALVELQDTLHEIVQNISKTGGDVDIDIVLTEDNITSTSLSSISNDDENGIAEIEEEFFISIPKPLVPLASEDGSLQYNAVDDTVQEFVKDVLIDTAFASAILQHAIEEEKQQEQEYSTAALLQQQIPVAEEKERDDEVRWEEGFDPKDEAQVQDFENFFDRPWNGFAPNGPQDRIVQEELGVMELPMLTALTCLSMVVLLAAWSHVRRSRRRFMEATRQMEWVDSVEYLRNDSQNDDVPHHYHD